MKSRVTVTVDKVNKVVDALNSLTRKQVLVGIPEEATVRDDEEGEVQPITNAALGYIHEFGAPGANIPARPFLIPGVKKSIFKYMPHLKGAARAALDGNKGAVDRELAVAGLEAEMGAKHEIHTGDFVPLKPATIRNRRRGRGTKSRREAEEAYLEMVKNGVSPAEAQETAGIRPLIDTGQLSNAITSVVREIKRG